MAAKTENKRVEITIENAPSVDSGICKIQMDETGVNEENKSVEKVKSENIQATAFNLVHKLDFQKDVAYLYQFPRTTVLPSLSPGCLQVETWLRVAGIRFENVDHKLKFRSPRGELPFVELNGIEYSDTGVIIKKLSSYYGTDLDSTLTKEENTMSYALTSMVENHLWYIHLYWRSQFPNAMIQGYKINLQDTLGTRVPKPVLNMIFKLTYSRKMFAKVKAHGFGVYSDGEILELGKKDMQALEEFLKDKQFFFGENPTNLDIVVFAYISQICHVDESVVYDLRDWALENCPKTILLIDRMQKLCYPDWEKMKNTLQLNTHLPEVESEFKNDKK